MAIEIHYTTLMSADVLILISRAFMSMPYAARRFHYGRRSHAASRRALITEPLPLLPMIRPALPSYASRRMIIDITPFRLLNTLAITIALPLIAYSHY